MLEQLQPIVEKAFEFLFQFVSFIGVIYLFIISLTVALISWFNPLTMAIICLGLGTFGLLIWFTGSIENAVKLLTFVKSKLSQE